MTKTQEKNSWWNTKRKHHWKFRTYSWKQEFHRTLQIRTCVHTHDAQTFLVKPNKGMADINGTATKMTVFIENSQHPLIIESGAHCSIVARNYLDNYFPNWEKQRLTTKAKKFKSSLGKMTSIGTIIKEMTL
ncbi:hypothetical protein O181_014191 [Austropuccinia psidii MF-1]|uniref:Uncharacterized protein n=1 Tax=Austropuccinia psidii MF-1 TaxID=1389203 RepID=A0A9Q3GNX8_9BASI|nr:hypothetical protein [Austropuccinia psidii MF-1]